MKKFMLVLVIVLCAIGILAACAPMPSSVSEGAEYVKTLPEWAIIVGAAVIFLIGFSIIWKFIHGVVKVVVIIALALVLAAVAFGVWPKEEVDSTVNDLIDQTVDGIESLTSDMPDYVNDIIRQESPTADEPTESAGA